MDNSFNLHVKLILPWWKQKNCLDKPTEQTWYWMSRGESFLKGLPSTRWLSELEPRELANRKGQGGRGATWRYYAFWQGQGEGVAVTGEQTSRSWRFFFFLLLKGFHLLNCLLLFSFYLIISCTKQGRRLFTELMKLGSPHQRHLKFI